MSEDQNLYNNRCAARLITTRRSLAFVIASSGNPITMLEGVATAAQSPLWYSISASAPSTGLSGSVVVLVPFVNKGEMSTAEAQLVLIVGFAGGVAKIFPCKLQFLHTLYIATHIAA